MISVLEGRSFDDAQTFLKELNAQRLAHGKAWITYAGRVAGREVRMKTYGASYLQIFDIDGIRHGGGIDMKPTAWKNTILKALGVAV
jgi:hypothetical protein